MKYYLLIFLSMFISASIFSQDTVHVFINNKAVAKFISNDKPASTSLKNTRVVSGDNIYVQLQPVSKNGGPYKQSLEITDCHEGQSETISLTDNRYAKADATVTLKKYNFYKGCYVKLYLLLNPANDQMMLPSKRIYLGDLSLK